MVCFGLCPAFPVVETYSEVLKHAQESVIDLTMGGVGHEVRPLTLRVVYRCSPFLFHHLHCILCVGGDSLI